MQFTPLSQPELITVLRNSEQVKQNLIIAGSIDLDREELILITGDFSLLTVSLSEFKTSGDGTKPDFNDFEVIDYGHTLRFGRYEAATDAVLFGE